LHEVPARAKGACRAVGDEEQTVGGEGNGSMERGTRSMDGGDRRIVGDADRDGGGSRNGSSRERER
jgi:hypothetical protein